MTLEDVITAKFKLMEKMGITAKELEEHRERSNDRMKKMTLGLNKFLERFMKIEPATDGADLGYVFTIAAMQFCVDLGMEKEDMLLVCESLYDTIKSRSEQ